MTEVEIKQNEPSPIDVAERELSGFMAGAEIGSPRLLAYSDELRRRSFWGEVSDLSESGGKKHLSQLRIAETGFALLQQQISNRNVEIKGYAAASFKVSGLISGLETACRIEIDQDDSSSTEEKSRLVNDSYFEIVWGLYNSLTTGTQN